MQEFEFYNSEKRLRHIFFFEKIAEKFYIEIRTYQYMQTGCAAWLHDIKNDEVVWRHDDFLELSPEAKDYINKIVKLKAFT
jgi:hypothetical protein